MMYVGDEWITIVPPGKCNPLRYIPDSLAKSGFSQTNFMMVAKFSIAAIMADVYRRNNKRYKVKKNLVGDTVQKKKLRFIIICMLLDEYKSLGLDKHGAVLPNGIRLPFGLYLLTNAGLLQGNVDKKDVDLPHFWVE